MVVNRERERFLQKLQRDSSLRDHLSSSLLEAQSSYNAQGYNRLFSKISPVKRAEDGKNLRRSVNLAGTVPASLLLNAVGAPTNLLGSKNQESLATLIGTDTFG